MKKFILVLMLIGLFKTHAQSILIPYRSGKLWGLADTLGKVRVLPAYDEITTSVYLDALVKTQQDAPYFYIVRKGNLYGAINRSKVVMPPKYHKLYVDSMFITEDNSLKNNPTVGGSREILYNLSGEVLIKDTVLEIKQVVNPTIGKKMLFSTLGYKNNSGVFWYDPKIQRIVQWIIKDVKYAFVTTDKDKLYVMVTKANEPEKRIELVFNPTTNKFEVKPAQIINSNRNVYGNQGPRSNSFFPSTKNNFLLRHIEFQVKGDAIVKIRKDQRYLERKGNTDTIRYKISFDSAEVIKYRQFNRVTWHSTIPRDNMELLNKLDSGFEFVSYVIYNKGGKKGLIAENVASGPLYNDITYFQSGMINKPFFMVSQTAKATGKKLWGVIGLNNNIILPCIYDEIIRKEGGGNWILKKDGLYGVADYQGKLIVPAQYEQVIPNELYSSFNIVDKGKYGFVSSNGSWFKPNFPFKVSRTDTFGNYDVLELTDKNEKVLGYADKKGFLYFKN